MVLYHLTALNQLEAQFLYCLASDLFENEVLIEPGNKSGDGFALSVSTKKRSHTNAVAVRQVRSFQKRNDEFVYDIETELGRFQAGVGNLIVKNTDSVFCRFSTGKEGRAALEESWKLARIAGEMITEKCFEPPNDLEFEKAYLPLLQMKKKHYMGVMYEYDDKNPDKIPEKTKIDKKGIVLKRRDNVPMVRKIFKACSDILLEKGADGVEEAKQVFRKLIQDMLTGEADMKDFTLSKEMKHNYAKTARCALHPSRDFRKSKCAFGHTQQQIRTKQCRPGCRTPNCPECKELQACGKNIENCDDCKVVVPHVVLAKRIKERNPGEAPGEGDRVPYVFVDVGNMTAKQFERVEDPQYALENGMRLDLLYYWEHQIKKPMTRLFGLVTENPRGICADLIRTYVRQMLEHDYNQKIPKEIRDYLGEDEQEAKKKHDRAAQAAARKRLKIEQTLKKENGAADKAVKAGKDDEAGQEEDKPQQRKAADPTKVRAAPVKRGRKETPEMQQKLAKLKKSMNKQNKK